MSIVLAIALSISVSCAPAEKTYTEEIRDGVTYIHNLKPLNENPRIGLEFIQKFGDLETDDENYQLYKPADVTVDSDDNIYILDAGNYLVKKFNPKGEFILSFGKQGQGPGEFSYPFNIGVNNNIIQISDPISHILMKFDRDGNFINSNRNDKLGAFSTIKNNKLLLSNDKSNSPGEILPVANIYDPEANLLLSFGKRKEYEDINTRNFGNTIFGNFDTNENIFLVYYFQNRVEKYSPKGDLILSITRESTIEPILEIKSKSVNDTKGTPKNIFRMTQFAASCEIDFQNRIWIIRNKRELTDLELADQKITAKNFKILEVYDNNGILLSEHYIANMENIQSIRIIDNKIFLIDATIEMAVYEYKIVDN